MYLCHFEQKDYLDTGNNFGRLLILLLLTLGICLGLYGLPDTLFGRKINQVDLLSDIRIKAEPMSLDSLLLHLEQTDTIVIDSAAIRNSVIRAGILDSMALVLRDSLYKVICTIQGADSSGTRIEDYSVGHTGLKRFFNALNNRNKMDRPVRIAFLGDSFIEGDIVVADFREALQKEFGGRGAGFIPVNSVAAQFRPTIEQKTSGWTRYSLTHQKDHNYTLPGMFFETSGEKSSISLKVTDRYPSLINPTSLKFIYEYSEGAIMELSLNNRPDTIRVSLPETNRVSQYAVNDTIREAYLQLTQAENFRALGFALESEQGVIVDNYSLRGNSGLLMQQLDSAESRELTAIRPYDLIIVQYGLNVINEEMLEYSWYRKGMVDVIRHIRNCFPEADLLMLSISDRAQVMDERVETMPAVLALLHAQRRAAQQTGTPFWNVFGAMGGENSMVRYVENNWASKDYTHLSFRGGREIAKALMNALKLEKEFYDEAEKAIP